MTPLKPIENTTRVRGVPSKRYPPNTVCAHPECDKPVESIHHIFGRPPGPDSDSWFVVVGETAVEQIAMLNEPIPHAIGLCGSGTTGHHGDLEEHRAWIRLEDGEFVWYDRTKVGMDLADDAAIAHDQREDIDQISRSFERIGPLNPQPGSREGKPKRRPRRKHDPDAPPPETWTIRAPQDDPELILGLREKVEILKERYGGKMGPAAVLNWAVDYVLLNSGPEDFE